MKKFIRAFLVVAVLALFALPLYAKGADFDYLAFAKQFVLKDYHPTANVDKATFEYEKKPASTGDNVYTARVQIFYEGWIKKHNMLVDISIMETPNGDMVRTKLLQDSNAVNTPGAVEKTGKLEKGWTPVAELMKKK